MFEVDSESSFGSVSKSNSMICCELSVFERWEIMDKSLEHAAYQEKWNLIQINVGNPEEVLQGLICLRKCNFFKQNFET